MAAKTSAERKRRVRVPKCLPAIPAGEQPFAKRRDELKGMSSAEMVLLVMESESWQQAMAPVLAALDEEREAAKRDRRGASAAYSAVEIEKALLFQRACGLRGYKEAYEKLCGADSEPRETLGFTAGPNRKKATRHLDGVPSRSTISRHLRRFGKERRGDAWDSMARALRDFHLTNFEEMREEARVVGLDGTAIKTHYTTPVINPKSKKVENEKAVTCPDGGHVPWSAGPDKSGNGWNLLPISSASGVPLAWSLPKLHESEPIEATKLVLDQFQNDVVPLLGSTRGIGVITADGAFSSSPLRVALRAAGYAENIHHVSHADAKKSRDRATTERARRVAIEGYPNWFANGHRELVCSCGNGATSGRYETVKSGRVALRVEGSCTKCGSITITSGKWRRAQNPTRYTEVDPSNPKEEPDYLFGNPLTFDNPLSAEFGRKRFGHCEGLYGTLSNRFGLNKGKRWFRSVHDARADVGIVFSIIHAVAIEQRLRKRADLALAPPGLAFAA